MKKSFKNKFKPLLKCVEEVHCPSHSVNPLIGSKFLQIPWLPFFSTSKPIVFSKSKTSAAHATTIISSNF